MKDFFQSSRCGFTPNSARIPSCRATWTTRRFDLCTVQRSCREPDSQTWTLFAVNTWRNSICLIRKTSTHTVCRHNNATFSRAVSSTSHGPGALLAAVGHRQCPWLAPQQGTVAGEVTQTAHHHAPVDKNQALDILIYMYIAELQWQKCTVRRRLLGEPVFPSVSDPITEHPCSISYKPHLNKEQPWE